MNREKLSLMIHKRPDVMKRFQVLLPVSPKKTDVYALLADFAFHYHLHNIVSSPKFSLHIIDIKGNHLELSVVDDSIYAKLVKVSVQVDKHMKVPLHSHEVALLIHDVVNKYGVDLSAVDIESKIRPIVTNSLLNHVHIDKLATLFIIDHVLDTNLAISSYLKHS